MEIVKNLMGKKAPPPQRGMSKAIYETLDTLSGPATFKEVWDLLPAAIDNSHQLGTKKKIHQTITGMVYRGYFIHDNAADRWSIAPLSYYEARQKYIDERKADPSERHYQDLPVAASISAKQSNRMYLMIGLAGGFLAGMAFGMLFTLAMKVAS